jgi:hypothetical protein
VNKLKPNILLKTTSADFGTGLILLSKVAKEKKYAQEYLGLLARRGDIGSIRIGKRWYTTWAWFEEFLENSQKKSSFAKATADKKEVVSEVQIAAPIVAKNIAAKEIPSVQSNEEKIKINVPFVFPVRLPARQEKEKVFVAQPVMEIKREEKIAEAPAAVETLADKPTRIAVAVNSQRDQIIVRKNIEVDKIDINLSASPIRPAKMQTEKIQIRRFAVEQSRKVLISNLTPKKLAQPILQDEPKLRNPSVEEKNRYAVPYQEMKFRKKEDIFSPDFAGEEKIAAPMFGRFAFAMSFALILLLVAASGYFVWSGGLLSKGTVAGASDERNAGFSGITSGGDYILVSAGDKMKESLSISRVMVEVAKQRVNQDNLVN